MTLRDFMRGIGRVAIPILAVALLQFVLIQPVDARQHRVTPRVFPPGSVPYGHTFGEWSAIYFQTAFSTPWDPAACSFERIGDVELLQSTLGGAGEWQCEVPPGTAFLWPVLTAFFLCPTDCGPEGPAPNGTPEEIRAAAQAAVDILLTIGYIMECEVDGVPVTDIWSYRVQSPVFYGEIVEGCIFNSVAPEFFPAGPFGPAVSDGFWVMVPPLSVGEHVIHFRAVVGTNLPEPLAEHEATHYITVVPEVPGASKDALALEPTTWGAIKATYRQLD